MFLFILAQILKQNFLKVLLSSIFINQFSISFSLKKENITDICFFIKNSSFFDMLNMVDLFVVDCLGRSNNYRFLVYYIFYSKKYVFNLIIKVYLFLYDLLNSITHLYFASGWLEREVYDMFGIFFYKNKDMRRILNDYGFEGFPLRKDFPLIGFFELQYSEEEKIVLNIPIKLGQAMRLFYFSNSWDFLKKNI